LKRSVGLCLLCSARRLPAAVRHPHAQAEPTPTPAPRADHGGRADDLRG
jgi:hypothetical protein